VERCVSCPGRGAAFFTMHRRAGTQGDAASIMGPGSAAHHAARAARCAASGARAPYPAQIPDSIFKQPAMYRHGFAISRREAPESWVDPSPRRAWGMPGAQCTRSRACSVESTRVSHHRSTGKPGIPARNGFNGLYRALPGDRAFLSPSSAEIYFRQLDASVEASGPHDFAVRTSALSSFSAACVHRIPPQRS
jgi:hypothetical protein